MIAALSNAQLSIAASTIWVVFAAVLVMFMQAGFAFLEAGLTRMKNVGHVAAKNVLIFVVAAERAEEVVDAIVDAARSGNESGDGLVWATPVDDVRHNRTGRSLKEVEVG